MDRLEHYHEDAEHDHRNDKAVEYGACGIVFPDSVNDLVYPVLDAPVQLPTSSLQERLRGSGIYSSLIPGPGLPDAAIPEIGGNRHPDRD
jgi:hypothetical protein